MTITSKVTGDESVVEHHQDKGLQGDDECMSIPNHPNNKIIVHRVSWNTLDSLFIIEMKLIQIHWIPSLSSLLFPSLCSIILFHHVFHICSSFFHYFFCSMMLPPSSTMLPGFLSNLLFNISHFTRCFHHCFHGLFPSFFHWCQGQKFRFHHFSVVTFCHFCCLKSHTDDPWWPQLSQVFSFTLARKHRRSSSQQLRMARFEFLLGRLRFESSPRVGRG